MIQCMFGRFEVTVERPRRAAIHHFCHRCHIIVVGRKYLDIATGDGQVCIARFRSFGQFKNGMAILVKLLTDLPK